MLERWEGFADPVGVSTVSVVSAVLVSVIGANEASGARVEGEEDLGGDEELPRATGSKGVRGDEVDLAKATGSKGDKGDEVGAECEGVVGLAKFAGKTRLRELRGGAREAWEAWLGDAELVGGRGDTE